MRHVKKGEHAVGPGPCAGRKRGGLEAYRPPWDARKASGMLGDVRGGTPLFADFKRGGTVVLCTAEEGASLTGRWSQSGNQVTRKAGASTFSGTVRGCRISATRSRRNAANYRNTDDFWHLDLD